MRDLLLVILVLGLVPLILYRAWWGALAWTWIGLVNPHLYLWHLTWIPFAQILGLAFFLGWIVGRDKRGVPWTAELIMLVAFLVFVAVKTPFAWNPVPAFGYLNQFAKIVLSAFLISTVIYSKEKVQALLWVILGSLAFFGVKGGIFTIVTGGSHRVQGPPGSFLDGNTFLGVALIMGLPLIIAFARNMENKWWRRAGYWSFWLTMLSIVFTYSRGALLGLGTVAPFLLIRARRKLLILIAVVPLIVVGISMAPEALFQRAATIQTYEQDLSALERLSAWSVARNVALSHPFGGGFVLDATPFEQWITYSDYSHLPWQRAAAAHSIYFQVLGEHGFLGLAMWLFILLGALITLQRVKWLAAYRSESRWLADYAAAIQIGLVGYAVAGAFVSLAYFDLFYTYVILAAILLREAREAQRSPSNSPVPGTVGAIAPN